MRIKGFKPYCPDNSVILILGSFPSVKSREQNFYYGHRQNRFWKTLAEFFGEEIPTDTDGKKALLDRHGIALWDIVTECEITGSQDNTIKNYETADVPELIARCPGIAKILLNGKTAAKIFSDAFPEFAPMGILMPSTSPANPRFDKNIWFSALNGALPH